MKMKVSVEKVILGVVILFAVWHVGHFMIYSTGKISKQKELQTLQNADAIAEACRLMLSSLGSNAFGNCAGDDPVVPIALRALKPRHVLYQQDKLRLEFHGGFDHFGLEFQPQEADCVTGKWNLVYYDEHGNKVLASVKQDNGCEPDLSGYRLRLSQKITVGAGISE